MSTFHTAIYDFDNTLFDTERLKRAFIDTITPHGLSEEEARGVYNDARDRDGIVTFTIPRFLHQLEETLRAKGRSLTPDLIGSVRAQLEANMETLDGALEQLKESQVRGHEMFLLSLGVQTFQHYKMASSGVKKFFADDHIICPVKENLGKLEALQTLFPEGFTGEGCVFFNDKPGETATILRAFPDMVGFVPRSVADERYQEEDFRALEDEFGERIVWRNSMREIHDEFMNKFPREVDESSREMRGGQSRI